VIFTVNAGSLHLRAQGSGWFGFTRNHLMFYNRDTLPVLLADTGFAGVGFAPFYGAKVVAVDGALTPRQLRRLKHCVDSTDFGSMLVAVGFATETAADRWGAELPDLRKLDPVTRLPGAGPGRPAGHGSGAGARSR
jgi:hypothetical protein